jgi:hypothetical protein
MALMHALACSLAVLAVYRFTLRECENRAIAFAAALLVACSPPAVRFSVSEGSASFAVLFTALSLDFLSLAAKSGEIRTLFVAAGWLTALVEVRPEGFGFALGALIFLVPRWKSLSRMRPAALATAGLLSVLLLIPRFAINAWVAKTSDLMPTLNPIIVAQGFMDIPYNDVTGHPWMALCLIGLAIHAMLSPRVLACRLLGLYVGTYILVQGFNLNCGNTTNIRYWLPALVLVSVPMASGLASLVAWMPKPISNWPRAVLLLLVLAAPWRTWRTMWTQLAAQEELRFVLRALQRIPDGCRILTRKPTLQPGALEIGPDCSVLAGRVHDWQYLDPADSPKGDFSQGPATACTVYYRGGRCAFQGRWDERDMPDDCADLEHRWQMLPIAESSAGGASLVAESYRTNPYPVGFFRISPRGSSAPSQP